MPNPYESIGDACGSTKSMVYHHGQDESQGTPYINNFVSIGDTSEVEMYGQTQSSVKTATMMH